MPHIVGNIRKEGFQNSKEYKEFGSKLKVMAHQKCK